MVLNDVLIYCAGMVIAFLFVTARAYYMLRKKYLIIPSIGNVWSAIVLNGDFGVYILAIIFYPIALLYCGFLILQKLFDLFILGASCLVNPNMKVIKAKIDLLQVGEKIKYINEKDLTLDSVRSEVIEAIEPDRIILHTSSVYVRFIRKKNFTII